ncbi:hypothetical protein [Armatimonas sp.]|uniref:hypothetical protein n=1 Tax=Armatimonas sp. TaxID=1872638 RepID=UPI0037500EDE
MAMEEIIARGKAIYERHLRSRLAIPENIGKLLMIDVDSGDYELGEDGNDVELFRSLRLRHPNARVFSLKVGFRTADAVGTSLQLEREQAA